MDITKNKYIIVAVTCIAVIVIVIAVVVIIKSKDKEDVIVADPYVDVDFNKLKKEIDEMTFINTGEVIDYINEQYMIINDVLQDTKFKKIHERVVANSAYCLLTEYAKMALEIDNKLTALDVNQMKSNYGIYFTHYQTAIHRLGYLRGVLLERNAEIQTVNPNLTQEDLARENITMEKINNGKSIC